MTGAAPQTHLSPSTIPNASLTTGRWDLDRRLSRALRLAFFLPAGAILIAGSIGVIASSYAQSEVPLVISPWLSLIQMGVFSAAGVVLILGAGRQERPIDLGTAFILVATSFARRPLEVLADVSGSSIVRFLPAVAVDAYLPYFLWRFFRDFPRGVARWRVLRVETFAITFSGIIATVLLLTNAILSLLDHPPQILSAFSAGVPSSQYWTIVYGLSIPIVPFALWKTSTARIDERRRLMLFLAGLLVAAMPVSLYIFLFSAWPQFTALVSTPEVHGIIMPIIQILIASVPLTMAYAVLVEHVFGFRLLLRLALQYSLARILVGGIAVAPFAWMIRYLYNLRDQTLTQVLFSSDALQLAGAALFGIGALRLRGRVADTIDRAFFRDQYDAKQILMGLTGPGRRARDAHELAQLLIAEIDRALHLESIAVLLADLERSELRAPNGAGRPLSTESELALLLADTGEPLPIDLERHGSLPDYLPDADMEWLIDTGAGLLVPLLSSTHTLIGVIVLGVKRSELPYSREDRQLLSLIASSTAMTIESRGMLLSTQPAETPLDRAFDRRWRDSPANECSLCHALQSSTANKCARCSHGDLSPATVPHVLLGKFRVESRIGQGGMGIVYRAIDLTLRRTVALKTLPKTSAEDSVRLRREARAMAAVVHPNLVLIYGIETWKGTPVLVVEYLDGGTLADRLLAGPLSLPEGRKLGLVLAGALEHLHSAGILHRDVKPSNIGYTASGVPKVLDFGLARMRRAPLMQSDAVASADEGESAPSRAVTDTVAGTPLYMSPESLRGEPPDASLDLWGATVVLFEALTGHHPFHRATWSESFHAITRAHIPDVRELIPECPNQLHDFFVEALSLDRRRRPPSAAELQHRLDDVLPTTPGFRVESATILDH